MLVACRVSEYGPPTLSELKTKTNKCKSLFNTENMLYLLEIRKENKCISIENKTIHTLFVPEGNS